MADDRQLREGSRVKGRESNSQTRAYPPIVSGIDTFRISVFWNESAFSTESVGTEHH